MCLDVAQVEKQRDELKADKDKVTADRDRLQQEWVTLQAEMQKRDIQMEEMKKEVGALLWYCRPQGSLGHFSEEFLRAATESRHSACKLILNLLTFCVFFFFGHHHRFKHCAAHVLSSVSCCACTD